MTFFYKHIVPTKSTPNARMAFVGTKEGVVMCKITIICSAYVNKYIAFSYLV